MHQDAKDILYTEEQLKARVAELGKMCIRDRCLLLSCTIVMIQTMAILLRI